MGQLIILIAIVVIIAILGAIFEVMAQIVRETTDAFDQLLFSTVPEQTKTVLEVSNNLKEAASKIDNKYYCGVEKQSYNPVVRLLKFAPSNSITPIDALRYSASPFPNQINAEYNYISDEEVKSLYLPKKVDEILSGKYSYDYEDKNFNLPQPPDFPHLQKLYPITEEELPSPKLNLPKNNLKGIKRRLFYGFLQNQIKRKYSKEIKEYKEWVKKRNEIISKYEKWNEEISASNGKLIEKFQDVKNQHESNLLAYKHELEIDYQKRIDESQRQKDKIFNIQQGYKSLLNEGIETYIELILKRIPLPYALPRNAKVSYSADSRIVIIEHQFPVLAELNILKLIERVKKNEWKPVNKSERKELVSLIYPALAIRIAFEVAVHDNLDTIEALVINGWLSYFDKATGQPKESYCLSLFVKKSELIAMNLLEINPIKSFQKFKGRSTCIDSYDIFPISPILNLNMSDKRFVDAKEVLDALSQDRNIATMDWEDFEHLVRELFEKLYAIHGAEVKVTQASRDLGVDAVIFDPTPIKGGKTIIQAKRYVNVVDLSAVRDLFGTVINEGANKGILVTTSYYGVESYNFAKDKPLELINSQQLLGLLEQYGYKFKINLDEARKLNSEQSKN